MHTGVIQSNKLSYKTKIFLIPLKSNFFSFKIIHEEDSQVRINTSISQASGSYVTATYCTRRLPPNASAPASVRLSLSTQARLHPFFIS